MSFFKRQTERHTNLQRQKRQFLLLGQVTFRQKTNVHFDSPRTLISFKKPSFADVFALFKKTSAIVLSTLLRKTLKTYL